MQGHHFDRLQCGWAFGTGVFVISVLAQEDGLEQLVQRGGPLRQTKQALQLRVVGTAVLLLPAEVVSDVSLGSACSSPEESRKALAQAMQEELLGDTSGSTPMPRQLTHVGFRGQITIAIGRTDGFTDA